MDHSTNSGTHLLLLFPSPGEASQQQTQDGRAPHQHEAGTGRRHQQRQQTRQGRRLVSVPGPGGGPRGLVSITSPGVGFTKATLRSEPEPVAVILASIQIGAPDPPAGSTTDDTQVAVARSQL